MGNPTRADRPDLADELWTPAHVAAYLHCGRSTAYRTVAEPDFPAALAVRRRGRQLWVAAEVRAWARADRRVRRGSRAGGCVSGRDGAR